MFVSLMAMALAGQQVTIPLGPKPVVYEKPKAPIEEAGPQWAAACTDWDDWDKPAPPVRIQGSSYLVGTCGISAILIVGDQGDILIDGTTEKGSDVVLANIRALGFKPKDIRIILTSHEHLDHVGGVSVLQQATGAKLYASETAAKVFETGAATPDDPQAGEHPAFRAARVDKIIKDGEEIRLGNLMVKAIATPGHTPGAMSYRWIACDGGVCPTVVYADSLTPVSSDKYRFSDHPAYLAAFRDSVAKIAASPCDILVTPHPSASDMRSRMNGEKPWRDDGGCKVYAAALTKKLDERLAKEATPEEVGK